MDTSFSIPKFIVMGIILDTQETEFPIYPYLVAILYSFTGVTESAGRVLSILFSLFTIYYLYLFIRKIYNEKTALWSCFFFSVFPTTIYFSRAFQPESLLWLSIVVGMYYFYLWSLYDCWTHFFLAAGGIAPCMPHKTSYLSILRFLWHILHMLNMVKP